MRSAAVLLIANTGCSLLFVPSARVPPKATYEQKVHVAQTCEDEGLKPVADVALAILYGFAGAGLVALSEPHESCGLFGNNCHTTKASDSQLFGGLLFIGLSVTHVVSAVSGSMSKSRCADLRSELSSLPPPPAFVPPEPPLGMERAFCRPDRTCDPGLTCASNRCVRL